MKIGIIGLNANASYFAMKLKENNEIFGIDNQMNKVYAINQDGIVISENDSETTVKFKAFMSSELTEVMDVVLLFVKSTQIFNAISENKNIFSKDTIVISFQNGIYNELDIAKIIDLKNIVIGVSELNCYNKDSFIEFSGKKVLHVASPVKDKKTLLKVKMIFDQVGLDCNTCLDLKTMVWKKFMVNLTLNPLCALFDCKMKVVYENKYIWEIAESIIFEAVEIAKLDSVNLDYEEMLEYVKNTIYSSSKAYPSMHRDLSKKRITEIDKLNGAILKLAYKNGYKVPYNSFVVSAIKGKEKLYS